MRKPLVASVLVGAFVVVAPEVARAAVTPDAAIEIKAAHSDKCLNVDHALTTDDAAILQYNCGFVNGRFRVVPKGDDAYQIVADYSGKCLNVYHANDADNTAVIQYTCSDTAPNNLWRFVPVAGRTTFRIVSLKSGKCLNVHGASTGLNTPVKIYTCTSSALNDQFYFPPATSGAAAPQPVRAGTSVRGVQGVPGGALVYGFTDDAGVLWRGYQADPDIFNVNFTPVPGFGSAAGDPTLAVGADGRVRMAARAAVDGDLALATETAPGSGAFTAMRDVGGAPGTQPVTGRLPDGGLVTFALAGGRLWCLDQSGTALPYGQWRYIGGTDLAGRPAVTPTATGLRVFVLDGSGALRTAVYQDGRLGDLTDLGGAGLITGSPGVLPGYVSRVVLRTVDGGIVTKSQRPDGTWEPDWTPIPGVSAAGTPDIVLDPRSGRTVILVRGTDRTVYYTTETDQASGQWNPWLRSLPTVVDTDPTVVGYRHATGDTWAYLVRSGYQVYVVTAGNVVAARAGAPGFTPHVLPVRR